MEILKKIITVILLSHSTYAAIGGKAENVANPRTEFTVPFVTWADFENGIFTGYYIVPKTYIPGTIVLSTDQVSFETGKEERLVMMPYNSTKFMETYVVIPPDRDMARLIAFGLLQAQGMTILNKDNIAAVPRDPPNCAGGGCNKLVDL